MKNKKLKIIGALALLMALTLNFRNAIDDYGVKENNLSLVVKALDPLTPLPIPSLTNLLNCNAYQNSGEGMCHKKSDVPEYPYVISCDFINDRQKWCIAMKPPQ